MSVDGERLSRPLFISITMEDFLARLWMVSDPEGNSSNIRGGLFDNYSAVSDPMLR